MPSPEPPKPSRHTELMRLIHEVSPYEAFDYTAYPVDLDPAGPHPTFQMMIEAVRPSLIIEVGTWRGNSAIYMAEHAKSLGLDTTIICVDTWLGGIEHGFGTPLNQYLLRKHGYPQLYFQFLANVMHRGHQDTIIPFPATSTIAARWFRYYGLKADLIYIDASHEYEDVKADLENYAECLSPRGYMFGDDYLTWPGVTQAVDEFALKRNGAFIGGPGKFIFLGENAAFDGVPARLAQGG